MNDRGDVLTLETPEQLEINYDIARLGSRFIAALWDTFFIGLLLLLLLIATIVALRILSEFSFEEGAINWGIAIVSFLVFLIIWGYYVAFELVWNGQTPGKRLASIRTVRFNGQPVGLSESAIRNIVRIIDFFPAAYGFGVVSMFIDRSSRRLGDFAAGTLVIHDKPAVQLTGLGAQVRPQDKYMTPAIPRLSDLTEMEVEAARRYINRRDGLVNDARMAAYLARQLRERLAIAEPEIPRHLDNVEFLTRVVAQYGNPTPL